jgi:hypothetical protein
VLNATDSLPSDSSEYFGLIAVSKLIVVAVLDIVVWEIFKHLTISLAKSYLDVKPSSAK